MGRAFVVGIMGPGENATAADRERAEKLGFMIAEKGWITLTGGRPSGVMEAALKGAKRGGGQTIGILPGKDRKEAAQAADIVIATGMNSGRNVINVLSSDVVVACGAEAGTTSEIAHAIKEKKPTILIMDNQAGKTFFKNLNPELVSIADTPEDVMKLIGQIATAGGERKYA